MVIICNFLQLFIDGRYYSKKNLLFLRCSDRTRTALKFAMEKEDYLWRPATFANSIIQQLSNSPQNNNNNNNNNKNPLIIQQLRTCILLGSIISWTKIGQSILIMYCWIDQVYTHEMIWEAMNSSRYIPLIIIIYFFLYI